MVDVSIPAPTEDEVRRALKVKIEQNQITVAIAGAIAQALWFTCDYFLIPESRLEFLILRTIVLIVPVLLCLYRNKLGLTASFCLFFAGVMVSFMIATVVCNVNETVFPTYVVGYAILFIGTGALATWERIYSILYPLISLVINVILYLNFSPIEIKTFIAEGMFPIFSCAVIGSLMIENRRTMQLKEIRSRMEIDHSRKVIEAQKNKLNEELDNFVYSVSHDLRSPLLSVKGILSFILTTEKMNDGAEKYLRLAQGSVERLDSSIQDILEYSRNSRLDVKHEHFDLRPVVQHIFDDIQFVSENPLRFEIAVDGSSMVYTDQTRLSTIIKNLASNGAKYRDMSAKECLIRFEMRHSAENLHIKVIDNGIGIPEGEQEKIFQMFYRLSTDRMGTGLGLFIVQEITRKLNGDIKLESEVGKGTCVELSIPREKQLA
jgi:signal transduction histidine kinase